MTETRYLNAQAVADYLSISRNMVDILVTKGTLPAPINLTRRLKRWDREAIDKALAGKPSSLQSAKPTSEVIQGIADGFAEGRSARQKAAERRQ